MPVLIPKHSLLRPHGTVHVTNCDGPELMRDTVMCGHCNRHGVYTPGCGKSLGKCLHCGGSLCPACARKAEHEDGCMTFERKLDLYEAGKLASL